MFDILVSVVYPAIKNKQGLGLEAEMSTTSGRDVDDQWQRCRRPVAEMSTTSGSFGTYLSILKRNGLIEVAGTEVKATDNLFIEARKE